MQWIAHYKDGTVIRQHDKGNSTMVDELDKPNIKNFRITEGTGDFALNLNVDSGNLKFSNLDFSKLQQLNGGESFSFVYDKESSSFKLDKSSFDFVQDIIIKNEANYFYMEFNDQGIINICGRTFKAGLLYDGKELPFYGSQYEDFKVTVDVVNDFYCNMSVPVKSVQGNSAYNLFLNKRYGNDDLYVDVSYQVVYDMIKWQSYIKMLIKPSKTIQAKMYIEGNEGQREINMIPLFAGSVSSYNKFMTVV